MTNSLEEKMRVKMEIKDKGLNPKEELLKDHLEYLGLATIAQLYQEVCERAVRENFSYIDFLEEILSHEVSSKRERAIKKRLKEARFPLIKTVQSFDFNYPKSINRKRVLNLLDLKLIEKKANLIIMGPPGTGKTHLALSIAYQACQQGIRTFFTTAINLINNLSASLSDHTFLKCMKNYTNPRLLIIDELGFLPIDKQGSELLFQVISSRYECGSIIVTTNLAFKDWGKIFNNDTTLASAVVDRLVHHSELLKIEGESYRVKKKEMKR